MVRLFNLVGCASFLMVALFAASPVSAQKNAPLPSYLALPPETVVPPDKNARSLREVYGEALFPKEFGVLRGEHWSMALRYPADAIGVAKPTGRDVFAKLAPALRQVGWVTLKEYDQNPFSAVLRYQKDGKDAWFSVSIFGPADIRADLVVVGPQPMAFVLTAPAATVENPKSTSADFADLPPLPGSKYLGSKRLESPMLLDIASPGGKRESIMVAGARVQKSYDLPDMSNLQFATVYGDAMTAAGWSIIEKKQGVSQGDAVLIAHYGKNGRNIWVYMRSQGGAYDIQLGEDVFNDQQLAKTCHVALYGVLFDFDRATLRPESDAILTNALGLLKAAMGSPIEVQGHTDNVGGDEYNQKLSNARAASVAAWFAAHGIAAAGLSSRGYGRTKPIADNNSPEGRAKNRRVEISRTNCNG